MQLQNRLNKLRYTKEMDQLKNAMKMGQGDKALQVVKAIVVKYFELPTNATRFPVMARILVTPDLEYRSPLYHAAHCGHADLVRLCLAVLVLARRYESHPGLCIHSGPMSFLGWFHALGFFPFHGGKRHFDACVLDCLAFGEIKSIFTEHLFSLPELRAIAYRTNWKHFLPNRSNTWYQNPTASADGMTLAKKKPKTTKKKGPSLNWDDDASSYTIQNHDEGDDPNVLEIDQETSNCEIKQEEESPSAKEEWEIGPESYPLLCGNIEQQEESLVGENINEVTETEDNDDGSFSFIEGISMESATIVDLDAMSNASCRESDEWSMVSEAVFSKSTETKPTFFSFRDVLMMNVDNAQTERKKTGRNFPQGASIGKINRLKAVPETNDWLEDEEEVFFGPEFIRDGAKDGRGGKRRLRFKGNIKSSSSGIPRMYKERRSYRKS